MQVRQTFECSKEHQFDKVVPSGTETARCPTCRGKAEILWVSERSTHSHMKEAVLVFRMSDGSYSFPGHNGARTPKGAERIEMRKVGEVRSFMKNYNQTQRGLEERKEERYMEKAQAQQDARRATLHHLMGQESDPAARDLFREALNRAHLEESTGYREVYNEAFE